MRRLHIGFFGKATWLAAFILLAGLSSCNRAPVRVASVEQPKLPYKVSGANDKEIISWQKRLSKHGVRVITLGQDYMISIPSPLLFAEESPRLRWESYALLNAVACYLKEFRKVAVTVSSFSNKCVSVKRDRALTLARARAVGDYLWSQGVDSRFIFTQGLGSDKPIVSFAQAGDKSPNSRIEIVFREAVI